MHPHAEKLALGVAGDLAEAFVHQNETAIELALGDPGCRLRDDGAKPLFAFAQGLIRTNPFRCFVDNTEDAQRLAIRIANRRVGNVEVNRFGIAVALDIEGPVLGGNRLAIVKNGAQKRFEVAPELGPVFLCGMPQGLRMLVADRRCIGIIIKRDKVVAPEHDDLGLSGEHDIDGSGKAWGPCRFRAEAGRCPVEARDKRCHLVGVTCQFGHDVQDASSLERPQPARIAPFRSCLRKFITYSPSRSAERKSADFNVF